MPAPSAAPRRPWGIVAALSIAGAVLVSVLVLAFLWPSKTSAVQDIPLALAGPEESVTAVAAMIEENADGAFDVVDASDRDDAVALVEAREAYGAIVLSAPPTAPEVITATAGSPAVAQMLTGMASQLQGQLAEQIAAAGGDPSTAAVTVTDVAPLSDDDPNGTGLAAAAFPLTIGGMLGGILVSLLVVGAARRLVALVGFSGLAGIGLAAILQPWFGYLDGGFWANALAIGLAILAISSFIVGCCALLGRAGMALAAVFTMLVANPLASAATPWEFLPEPWGAIGQHLAPGAANHLLRSLSYFPDAPVGAQWGTLVVWALVGVVLILAGALVGRRNADGGHGVDGPHSVDGERKPGGLRSAEATRGVDDAVPAAAL